MIRIVIFSGDSKLQPLLSAALGSAYSVVVESNTVKLKRLLKDEQIDVLILDLSSDASVTEQLALFDEIGPSRLPILAMTEDDRRSTALQLLQRGVYDIVRKPPSLVELRVIIQHAYEGTSLKRELEKMRQAISATSQCDRLVGSSGRAQVVYEKIRRVADLNAFVLITGQSGTGKELVARAIHNTSERRGSPFVAVSCGAIPETLIEAELFGHEKGAYTGTTGAREGHLEHAGEGTLFLDEIGDLSLTTQVKLLRVLQQREFTRLGSNRVLPLKARVVFATNRNLEEMVEQGTFRRDLFFRVNVMRIHVPPLCDRTEDIPMLARHFVQQYSVAYGKPVKDVDPNAMELLVDYDWPGNIRELENVIQGAVIYADGDTITAADLPDTLHSQEYGTIPIDGGNVDAGSSFEEQLRQHKLALVNRALAECKGNKTLAASRLQISRAYLHRLLRADTLNEIVA
jgi:DNA-binding NtrC family response regulator